MMSRRNFCQATLISAVAAELAVTPAGAETPVEGGPSAILFDRNIPQSQDFAGHLSASGRPAFGFATDPSHLWLEHLAAPMLSSPARIAGLTTQGALFCLERWGWEAGMRVMLRIDHVGLASGGWHHSLASRPDHPALAEMRAAGSGFGSVSARLVRSGSGAWTDSTHAAPPRIAGPAGEKLVSWVIAPVSRS